MRTDNGDFSEWTCEGGPKALASSFRRSSTVTVRGICQYAVKRTFIVNLGGTAEVELSGFCPFWDKSLFVFHCLCTYTAFILTPKKSNKSEINKSLDKEKNKCQKESLVFTADNLFPKR